LRLEGNGAALSDRASPAFVGHRQRFFNTIFRTRLSFAPLREGEEAGLAVRLNERAHYDLAVARRDSVNEIFVRSRCNDTTLIIGREIVKGTDFILQIESSAIDYTFSFLADTPSFSRIAVLGAKDISPEFNASFTGAVIGMYATGNGECSSAPADFDWFECLPR
jgi:alpha-N-arabinofuranosidase